VDSGAACSSFSAVEPVDVALLKARYIAAFEHYLTQAAKLTEQSQGGRPPLLQQLDEERKALEDFAAVRSSLLVALAMSQPQMSPSLVSPGLGSPSLGSPNLASPNLAAETRDEVIRRSIAKRDQASLDSARKRRLNRRRRIA
jgi:hypothetical protein